ncbi:MAG: DNA gyrase subunit A, partial [Anaerolineales bacterium]|nr:DNA gyrase subunit A [Anaerolineales bacterium]
MDIGTVRQVDIDEQMRGSYLDYAMSVIVARALPDARDGLKPVHRRILYAMHDMGMRSNSAYRKSARIVGEVLGKYHPHGDAAVYDAMARMAQDFSMRYMLVDGQGNFGSIDGDAPAAMRYTEARLAKMAEELLIDIDKNTVDFVDNFDGSLQEPTVLPARLPNLLLNGATGIAVGMATNIPPHNLVELANAIGFLVDEYDRLDEITSEELMHFVPGPDFPTGGMIVGGEGIKLAYSTGKGRIVVRGIAHIEEMGSSRHRIVITELPYMVNKAALIERIAELAREGRLGEISDLRDESDRRGLSVVVELKRGAQPKKVLNQLFKYTALQSTFGVQLLALVHGEPRLLSLKRALHIYIDHRREVITRRSAFELEKARARAHILDGLLLALANLDEVIKTIRQSADADEAKARLVKHFKLSEIQAQAIL